jgi:hypothetical protein
MLGCLFGSGAFPYAAEDFADTVITTAPAKLVETNSRAFWSGAEFSRQAQPGGPVTPAPPPASGGASDQPPSRHPQSVEDAS